MFGELAGSGGYSGFSVGGFGAFGGFLPGQMGFSGQGAQTESIPFLVEIRTAIPG